MKKRRNFTFIQNELLSESQLTIPARYLMCVLTRYAGQDDGCFPSQKTLGRELGCTDRYIRTLLNELIKNKLIHKKRTGFNKSNTYIIAKDFVRNQSSGHIGTPYPLHTGNDVPPNITYRKVKEKKVTERGMELIAETLKRHNLPIPQRATSPKGK